MNSLGLSAIPANTIPSGSIAAGEGVNKDTPEAIAKAASQFESLLIGQLLQSARSGDDGGWLGTDSDDAGATLTEMSEQALSSALASRGGLGLATLITKGLQRTVDQTNRVKQEG